MIGYRMKRAKEREFPRMKKNRLRSIILILIMLMGLLGYVQSISPDDVSTSDQSLDEMDFLFQFGQTWHLASE